MFKSWFLRQNPTGQIGQILSYFSPWDFNQATWCWWGEAYRHRIERCSWPAPPPCHQARGQWGENRPRKSMMQHDHVEWTWLRHMYVICKYYIYIHAYIHPSIHTYIHTVTAHDHEIDYWWYFAIQTLWCFIFRQNHSWELRCRALFESRHPHFQVATCNGTCLQHLQPLRLIVCLSIRM